MIHKPAPEFLLPDKNVSGKRPWGRNIKSGDKRGYAEVQKSKNPEPRSGLWTRLKWLNLITQVSQVPVPETVFHPLLAGDVHCRLGKLLSKTRP